MTTIRFRDADGVPLADAIVVVTAAPGEMTDIGYVTAGDGTLALTVTEPGDYAFVVTAANGRPRHATAHLTPDGEIDVTAR